MSDSSAYLRRKSARHLPCLFVSEKDREIACEKSAKEVSEKLNRALFPEVIRDACLSRWDALALSTPV